MARIRRLWRFTGKSNFSDEHHAERILGSESFNWKDNIDVISEKQNFAFKRMMYNVRKFAVCVFR